MSEYTLIAIFIITAAVFIFAVWRIACKNIKTDKKTAFKEVLVSVPVTVLAVGWIWVLVRYLMEI